MQLSSRSLWLVLFLGLGCGPTGAAARDLEVPGSDGGDPLSYAGQQGGSPGTTGGAPHLGSSSVTGGSGGAQSPGPSPQATGGAIGTGGAGGTNGPGSGSGGSFAAATGGAGPGGTGGAGSGADAGGSSGDDAGVVVVAPTAAQLLARLTACQELTTGRYAADSGGSANVAVCGLAGAVYWKADMDINCNGKSSTSCNADTDPGYQPQTAGRDSLGDPLNAATLPFVVVPGPSARFDFRNHDIAPGSVVAVIYKGQVEYGVVGEVGAVDIIGEASFAMAKKLGIDPDPATGGVGSGVTYLIFTGPGGRVNQLEDRGETVRTGQARAADFLR